MLITSEQRCIANQLNKMDTFSKLRPPDAVRIKAKLIERECVQGEETKRVKKVKKFCVDPMVTSYDILFNLICQAFSIKDDFQMSYLDREMDSAQSGEKLVALYNDWDLDAAFLTASEPYLSISVELKQADSLDSVYNEWEVIHSAESAMSTAQLKRIRFSPSADQSSQVVSTPNRSLMSSAADKAVSVLNRMFSFSRSNSSSAGATDHIDPFDMGPMEQGARPRPPLADPELKNFMDCDGRIVQSHELRQRIFEGGCDPSKRRQLWPILLDIYPSQHMSQLQRNDFIHLKQVEYKNLKHSLWYNANQLLHQNSSQMVSDSSFDSNFSDEQQLHNLAHKIYKDVWRTDRNHKFYSGETNKNTEALFNILMTYTLSNGGQPYSQGMSDLLSPLLYVLKDEALAYYCFCALMARCGQNFEVTSHSITTKIRLLGSLIQNFDPELWSYLCQVGAEQLLFVYRWLLIECKREFPFNDCLRVFEIMWSSIQSTNLTANTTINSTNTPTSTTASNNNNNNNNNNACSNCKICDNNEHTELDTDTDIESVTGFDYYNHLRRSKERRRRRLSLNSSFYSHKSNNKFKPSSLNTNCFLSELREQQYEEKMKKKNRHRVHAREKLRAKSVECVKRELAETRSKSELNLRISYDSRAKRVPALFAKKLRSSLLGNCDKWSESEGARKQRPSSTSSDLSDDLNKLALKVTKSRKKNRAVKSSSRTDLQLKDIKKKILFKSIKKSLEKSHLRISKKFTKYQTQKSCASSKSSTSAYVSAGSVLSSASSLSSCSNTYHKTDCSPPVAIRAVESEPGLAHQLDQEQLVHELSKLDNPFLLFVCFAMFLENRQLIINSQMDANDIACFFDKMTRKHNVKNVLTRARYLYTKLYLAKMNAITYIQQLIDIQNSP